MAWREIPRLVGQGTCMDVLRACLEGMVQRWFGFAWLYSMGGHDPGVTGGDMTSLTEHRPQGQRLLVAQQRTARGVEAAGPLGRWAAGPLGRWA